MAFLVLVVLVAHVDHALEIVWAVVPVTVAAVVATAVVVDLVPALQEDAVLAAVVGVILLITIFVAVLAVAPPPMVGVAPQVLLRQALVRLLLVLGVVAVVAPVAWAAMAVALLEAMAQCLHLELAIILVQIWPQAPAGPALVAV